jgi:hypothetical protein
MSLSKRWKPVSDYVERQNLDMRMQMRRLTNAFSKTLEDHMYMVALFHVYHNFDLVHQTLRVTPAMAAGISQHVWSVQEIVGLGKAGVLIAA